MTTYHHFLNSCNKCSADPWQSSLYISIRENGKCCEYPVHEAAKIGAVKLMEFILRTEYDMNFDGGYGRTIWHVACIHGRTETAQLIIQSSKDFGIDLNDKDISGMTAWHWACWKGKTKTVQLIIFKRLRH